MKQEQVHWLINIYLQCQKETQYLFFCSEKIIIRHSLNNLNKLRKFINFTRPSIYIIDNRYLKLMLNKGAETLPNKVAHDYKALAKLYDAKNHKKGIKCAEKILQSHPDHPETIAMKALFELQLGEQAKAQATAKVALLKSMMKSMFCWHTYGSIHKRRKNYVEAAKCFEQSLKFQKDNMQILRETAALQVQIRDHVSHVATRWKLLELKPNLLYNWAAFAVAQHLKGDFEQLYKSFVSIDRIRIASQMKPIEISHYFIYRAVAYNDGERFDKMYEQLTTHKQKIMDEDIWNELMFKCCLKLDKQAEAETSIEFLIRKFPQNTDYIKQYQSFKKLTPRQVYQKLITQFQSKIAKIYQLSVIQDKQQFKTSFSGFIKPYYQKNLISLYAEIQRIYQNSPNPEQIQVVLLEFEKSLKDNKYPDGTSALFPTEYLWSLYLLAQHYSRKFQTLKLAHQYICKAIQHTNTVSEFYLTKAEIEYKLHNNLQALKTINQARKTDLADRYMNNICIQYLMKCMKPSIAEDVLRLFMRDQAGLYQLQNQWYIIQAGKAFLKMRKFESGLRHLNFIEKQFIDMKGNQFDFHTYCIRKWTLREYVEYISFNDNIYQDKKYMEAAAHSIQNLFEYKQYLANYIPPKGEDEQTKQQTKTNKKKKKKNKKVQEIEQLTPVQTFRKNIDYYGKVYAEGIKNDPLAEALVYAKNVASAKYVNKGNLKQNKLYAKAYSSAIRTFIHFNKPLLAIRCHKKLLQTSSDSYLEHRSTIKIVNYLKKVLSQDNIHQVVKENVNEHLVQIIGEQNVADYHLKKLKELPLTPLKDIKYAEIELTLNNKDTRSEEIQLYKSLLDKITNQKQMNSANLEQVFYLVHKLEFYGQFESDQKNKLNQIYGSETTYFTNWFENIDKLPESTWSLFWLSDYDQQRQDEYIKKEQEKRKQEEKKKEEGKNITEDKIKEEEKK